MLRDTLALAALVALVCGPAYGQARNGVRTGPEAGGPGVPGGVSEPGFVDFDDNSAPCFFNEAVAVTDEFARFGVTFEGPGGNDGGAVLDECSTFGITGHSSPNFLAFNVFADLLDGGTAQGPETMVFDPLVASVTLNCGSPSVGGATLECFDSLGTSLGSDTLENSTTLAALAVVAPDIATCVLSFTSVLMVCDDLEFEEVPVELERFEIE